MTPTTAQQGRGQSSTAGRPLTVALELLGRRWALRIVWELRKGPVRATELQARCDQMSTSVLYQRLRELADAGLVRQDTSDAYALTDLGSSLADALGPVDDWAKRWSRSAGARRFRAGG